MKLAKGPRPWSIWTFAALVLLQGVWHLGTELVEIYEWTAVLETVSPEVRARIDWDIITACARFTIVCIPVGAIWFLASKIAKWLTTATASFLVLSSAFSLTTVVRAISLVPYLEENLNSLITPISLGIASALLFTEPSSRWFQKKESDHASAFE